MIGNHEVKIFLPWNKEYICFQGVEDNPSGTEYIRFVDAEGEELVYWDHKEWEQEPVEVMGAIMGALLAGAKV